MRTYDQILREKNDAVEEFNIRQADPTTTPDQLMGHAVVAAEHELGVASIANGKPDANVGSAISMLLIALRLTNPKLARHCVTSTNDIPR